MDLGQPKVLWLDLFGRVFFHLFLGGKHNIHLSSIGRYNSSNIITQYIMLYVKIYHIYICVCGSGHHHGFRLKQPSGGPYGGH